MRFTQDQTLKFVALYVENECLWNVAISDYKSKHLRQKAIQSIISEMNLPGLDVVEVKNKIKNLRSTYNQEVNKIKRSAITAADTGELYVPPMKWFDLLDMVIKQIKGYDEDSLTALEPEDRIGEDGNKEDIVSYVVQCADTPNQDSNMVQHAKKHLSIQHSPKSIRKLKASKRKLKEVLSTVRGVKAASENPLQPDQEMSENEAFGKYVVKGLDSLPPLESVLAQQEIQNILTKYRISVLQSKSIAYETVLENDNIVKQISYEQTE